MIKEAMRLRANCEREELLGPFWCVNLRSIRWTVAPIVEAGESFPPVPNGTRENQLLLDCGEENTHRETGWLQCFGTQSKYFELTMHTPVCTIIQRASRRVFRQTFATNSGSYKTQKKGNKLSAYLGVQRCSTQLIHRSAGVSLQVANQPTLNFAFHGGQCLQLRLKMFQQRLKHLRYHQQDEVLTMHFFERHIAAFVSTKH